METNKTKNWEDRYYHKKIINLKENLSDKELEILKKLDIEIEDKVYTQYEYDIMMQKLDFYYDEIEDEGNDEAKEYKKSLEDKDVSIWDYRRLIITFDELSSKYIYV